MDTVANNLSNALLTSPAFSLNSAATNCFDGAAIYALYYNGSFPPYAALVNYGMKNQNSIPIYIGGVMGFDPQEETSTQKNSDLGLHKRLNENTQSIEMASSTLNINDFYCRVLPVNNYYVTLGKEALVDKIQPIWNVVIKGFGNHNPGVGRHQGRRPKWDVIHPGRPWAEMCAPFNINAEGVIAEIYEHFKKTL